MSDETAEPPADPPADRPADLAADPPADSAAKPAKWRSPLWWPVLAFILMIAWSNIPPYRHQVKNHKRELFSWHWKLYRHGGAKVCDLRYFDMNRGGESIKRWELLGYDRPGEMPDKLGRIHANRLKGDYGRVCAAMREAGDAEPNVEVFARCGFDGGWKVMADRKVNVCERSQPRSKKKKKSRSKPKPKAKGGG